MTTAEGKTSGRAPMPEALTEGRPWIRIECNMIDDPHFAGIVREFGANAVAQWVEIVCQAKLAPEFGVLVASPDQLADRVKGTPSVELWKALEAGGFIQIEQGRLELSRDVVTVRLPKFDRWQTPRAQTPAERKRAERARKRAAQAEAVTTQRDIPELPDLFDDSDVSRDNVTPSDVTKKRDNVTNCHDAVTKKPTGERTIGELESRRSGERESPSRALGRESAQTRANDAGTARDDDTATEGASAHEPGSDTEREQMVWQAVDAASSTLVTAGARYATDLRGVVAQLASLAPDRAEALTIGVASLVDAGLDPRAVAHGCRKALAANAPNAGWVEQAAQSWSKPAEATPGGGRAIEPYWESCVDCSTKFKTTGSVLCELCR